MSVRRRAAVLVAAPVVLVGLFVVAGLLPGVHPCVSVSCGPHYDPGGANVFGSELFTLAQSVVIALGILIGAGLLGRGVLPAGSRWTPVGFGVCVLALVIAFTLPSPTTGPEPSVPCTTPGPSGPIVGGCVTGPAPVDERLSDRAALVVAGVCALVGSALLDRRRGRPSVYGDASQIPTTGPQRGGTS